MRTLVVGDVHGCADELARLIKLGQPDRIVLVGDLYTKGPDPAGVWQLIREHDMEVVLGNHDARLLDVVDGKRPRDVQGHEVVARLGGPEEHWCRQLREAPLWLKEVAGYTVVHAGVHPSGKLSKTTRGMALAMRRWPQGDPEASHWHAIYRGRRKIVFGHDAQGGLVRVMRDGTPWIMGLDTGCVYGGVLTGWWVERDRVLQVPARRVYLDPTGRVPS